MRTLAAQCNGRPTKGCSISDGEHDPELELLLFQFGRYLQISSSRDASPANLQGLWCISTAPPRRSDFHTDINIEMNYWPTDVTNMSECFLPFFHWVQSIRAGRTDRPRRHFICRGWTMRRKRSLRRLDVAVDSRQQCMALPEFVGPLRLHPGQTLPQGTVSGAQGDMRILGRPPDGSGPQRWSHQSIFRPSKIMFAEGRLLCQELVWICSPTTWKLPPSLRRP